MSTAQIEIEVVRQAGGWGKLRGARKRAERAAEAAVAAAGVMLGPDASLCIALSDDATVAGLNGAWRQKQGPTNVLSFPAGSTPGGSAFLGDIILAFETLLREAEHENKLPLQHLEHLVVHGTLHLLGFDHQTSIEAEAMEALETRILAGLGVPDPYAATVPTPGEPVAALQHESRA
jgi:probable rRNA maturation factor